MITVLDIKKDNAGGIKRLLGGILKRGEIRTEVKSGGGIRVKYIECTLSSGKPDWKKIESCAGAAKGYILCKKSLPLPSKMGFNRFHSMSLSRIMALNGAISVLSMMKSKCRRISLCLCDEQGEYIKYAPLFLPLCRDMKIISESGAYNSFPGYAMGEYGACVQLFKSERDINGCDVFISPRFRKLEAYTGCDAVMFTAGGASRNPRIKTVNGYLWDLPQKYRALKPFNMSSEYFSQALFSIEKNTAVARVSPHAFYINGCACSAEEILSLIPCGLDRAGTKAYN